MKQATSTDVGKVALTGQNTIQHFHRVVLKFELKNYK